jgi:hypothetical protein
MLTYSLQRIKIVTQAKEEEKQQWLLEWVEDNVRHVQVIDDEGNDNAKEGRKQRESGNQKKVVRVGKCK